MMKNNKSIDKEFYEIKIRGVPADVYKILLKMQDEEDRPSLNNFLLVKLKEIAKGRESK
jgi:hypothetical protein